MHIGVRSVFLSAPVVVMLSVKKGTCTKDTITVFAVGRAAFTPNAGKNSQKPSLPLSRILLAAGNPHLPAHPDRPRATKDFTLAWTSREITVTVSYVHGHDA